MRACLRETTPYQDEIRIPAEGPPSPAGAQFSRITRLAVALTGATKAFVSLVGPGDDMGNTVYGGTGAGPAEHVLPVRALCEKTFNTGRAVRISEPHAGLLDCNIPASRALSARAYASVPLISSTKLIVGALLVLDVRPRLWSDNDLLLLISLAAIATGEAEKNSALSERERAVVQRERHLADVCHDLRNPLQTIRLAAAIAGRVKEEGERTRNIERLHRATAAIFALADSLADLEGGKESTSSTKMEAISVDTFIRTVLDDFQPHAEERRLVLAASFPPHLPQVMARRDHLARVFSNLVGNALKFTPAGGRVLINADSGVGAVTFSVADNGIGITENDLRRIFDRRWQANAASGSGAGLGLSIVQAIVSEHHGKLTVDSEPNHGTTVRFTMPTLPAEEKTTFAQEREKCVLGPQ